MVALEKKCKFLQTIIDEVPADIYTAELEDKVTWCNKTNEDNLGYTLEEIKQMVGLNYLYEVVYPDDCNVSDKSNNYFAQHPEK